MVNLLLNSGASLLNGKPIIFLTQWKMMGNSVVHTDEHLTQWKVSGNSAVDNNAILSCGDLGQDGKYHVKISNGVDVFDIALTEPLRMISDDADTIEYTDGVATVTRNIASVKWNELTVVIDNQVSNYDRFRTDSLSSVILLPNNTTESRLNRCLSSDFVQNNAPINKGTDVDQCMATHKTGSIYIRDTSVSNRTEFQAKYGTHELLYRLATPTTEVIQVSPFSISPTDTYTSANDTPYSAFEYKKNVEIWSCGEYSAVDGKYHILVQPLGGSIADIALDEPLRKVNDVADSIEFTDGVATLTRKCGFVDLGNLNWEGYFNNRFRANFELPLRPGPNDVCQILNAGGYTSVTGSAINASATQDKLIAYITLFVTKTSNGLVIRDESFSDAQDAKQKLSGIYAVYELAIPTTEVIQVPQIEEADSYSMVISQGGKAVEWSNFETD